MQLTTVLAASVGLPKAFPDWDFLKANRLLFLSALRQVHSRADAACQGWGGVRSGSSASCAGFSQVCRVLPGERSGGSDCSFVHSKCPSKGMLSCQRHSGAGAGGAGSPMPGSALRQARKAIHAQKPAARPRQTCSLNAITLAQCMEVSTREPCSNRCRLPACCVISRGATFRTGCRRRADRLWSEDLDDYSLLSAPWHPCYRLSRMQPFSFRSGADRDILLHHAERCVLRRAASLPLESRCCVPAKSGWPLASSPNDFQPGGQISPTRCAPQRWALKLRV